MSYFKIQILILNQRNHLKYIYLFHPYIILENFVFLILFLLNLLIKKYFFILTLLKPFCFNYLNLFVKILPF